MASSRRIIDGKHPASGTKLEEDPSLVTKIANVLRIGAHVEIAAIINGINYNTLRSWVVRGKENPDTIFGEFNRAVEIAFGQAEIRDLSVIDLHANGRPAEYEMDPVKDSKGDIVFGKDGNPVMEIARNAEGNPIIKRSEIAPNWKAAAWKLERRHPKRWGRVDTLAVIPSVMDAEQDMQRQEKDVITLEQKQKKIAEIKQLVTNMQALEDDPYRKK